MKQDPISHTDDDESTDEGEQQPLNREPERRRIAARLRERFSLGG